MGGPSPGCPAGSRPARASAQGAWAGLHDPGSGQPRRRPRAGHSDPCAHRREARPGDPKKEDRVQKEAVGPAARLRPGRRLAPGVVGAGRSPPSCPGAQGRGRPPSLLPALLGTDEEGGGPLGGVGGGGLAARGRRHDRRLETNAPNSGSAGTDGKVTEFISWRQLVPTDGQAMPHKAKRQEKPGRSRGGAG